jgi:uncharacterized protein
MPLIIETGRLANKPEKLHGNEPAVSLELNVGDQFRPAGPLSYDLTVQRISSELIVKGTLEIGLGCRCARCGGDFIKKIFIPDFYRNFVLPSKNELINLTPDLREDILLSLPMVVVCSDTCRGVCGGCKVNLNREKCKCKPQAGPDAWQALDGFEIKSLDKEKAVWRFPREKCPKAE